jgi:hypothetical protein
MFAGFMVGRTSITETGIPLLMDQVELQVPLDNVFNKHVVL